jgi:hypothetical protein
MPCVPQYAAATDLLRARTAERRRDAGIPVAVVTDLSEFSAIVRVAESPDGAALTPNEHETVLETETYALCRRSPIVSRTARNEQCAPPVCVHDAVDPSGGLGRLAPLEWLRPVLPEPEPALRTHETERAGWNGARWACVHDDAGGHDVGCRPRSTTVTRCLTRSASGYRSIASGRGAKDRRSSVDGRECADRCIAASGAAGTTDGLTSGTWHLVVSGWEELWHRATDRPRARTCG